MSYETELKFLRDIYSKKHLSTAVIAAEDLADEDESLRRRLGLGPTPGAQMFARGEDVREKTLYRLLDAFLCSYLLLRLPGDEGKLLLVGPYLTHPLSREQQLELAEQCGVPPQRFRSVESFLEHVPIVGDISVIFAPMEAFCECLWGSQYAVEDVRQELISGDTEGILSVETEKKLSGAELMEYMRRMEKRYDYENELMQAVALGHTHKAEMFLNDFSHIRVEKRLSDPVRNLKNYAIIMNTLMRKAAQQGGVHPVYLDRMSSDYARRIEEIRNIEEGSTLMTEIFRGYCRLVKRHSTKNYSSPVQKAVIQIDADLSADLSLKMLADSQNINASYLSALFKKETGQTVTDYVSQKRVSQAKRLLSETRLQVQTVAQLCGISDVNYFTKIFKKYAGKTPRQYRQDGGPSVRSESVFPEIPEK